jgi:O-antigen/teichoic acid export membrane protein
MIVMAERRRASPAGPASLDERRGSTKPAVTREFRRAAMITYLGGAALYNFDVLLLALIASQGDVATYSAAWRVAAGASLVNTAISQAVLPYTIAAADPWREARLLSKAGVTLGTAWLVLVPVITLIGVTILGDAGDGAAGPMAILLAAFALDGFCDVTVQIYFRINRARIAALASTAELATMMAVTVALQETGAYAPSIGQLAARVVGVLIIATPLVLAGLERLDWFHPGGRVIRESGALGVEVQSAEERLGL